MTEETAGARARRRRFVGRFAACFGGALGLYFLLTLTVKPPGEAYAAQHPVVAWTARLAEGAQEHALRPYQRFLAGAAGGVLDFFGYGTVVSGVDIRSERFAVTVSDGCDGLEVSLLFAAALLAFPARVGRKLVGLGLGLVAIAAVNFARIVTLWMVGAHWPGVFEFAHFNVWPVLFIVFALAVFVVWLRFVEAPVESGSTSQAG